MRAYVLSGFLALSLFACTSGTSGGNSETIPPSPPGAVTPAPDDSAGTPGTSPSIFTATTAPMSVLDRPSPPSDRFWHQELTAPRAPFKSAYAGENEHNGGGMLVVQLDSGWYAAWSLFDFEGNNKYNHTDVRLSLEDWRDTRLLRIDIEEVERVDSVDEDHNREWSYSSVTSTAFCGVGASGKPSCTARLTTRREEGSEAEGAKPRILEQRTLALQADKLRVTEAGQTKEHVLVFP